MDLILNERSLDPPASGPEQAREWMDQLNRTAQAAFDRGAREAIRTTREFWAVPLAPGYNWRHWVADPRVDRDLRRRLLGLLNRSPFVEDLSERRESAEEIRECLCFDLPAIALAYATLENDACLSYPSGPWRSNPLDVKVRVLTADGWLPDRPSQVRNWSSPEAVRRDREWLLDRIADEVKSGIDLIGCLDRSLGRLRVSPHARRQIAALSGRERPFDDIVIHLIAFHLWAADWTGGPFPSDPLPFDWSSESEPTMNRFASSRTFPDEQGINRVFPLHSKITTDAWRIHFRMTPDRRILIGYVGPHLPTVGDPT